MQINEIVQAIAPRAGQNLCVMIGRSLKTRKGVEANVEKLTRVIVRGGIEYNNQRVVVEGRESGSLPAENAGLPWGEWVQYPLHITHKGQDYARFYPPAGLAFEPHAEYYLEGELTTKEAIRHLCLASEFPKPGEEPPLALTIKTENVRAILI